MDPDTLNMLLFLKMNMSLWPDARIIQEILNSQTAGDLEEDDANDAIARDVESDDEEEDEYENMRDLKLI
jgi:hypothetical protein